MDCLFMQRCAIHFILLGEEDWLLQVSILGACFLSAGKRHRNHNYEQYCFLTPMDIPNVYQLVEDGPMITLLKHPLEVEVTASKQSRQMYVYVRRKKLV